MIRAAGMWDKDDWYRLDRHITEEVYEEKIRNRQAYVLIEDGKVAGILRYNLFWDNTPFCTMLVVDDMREQGYGLVMTSTQVNEEAQHFYRKLGYRDCGGFVVDIPGYEQPMEMIMIKAL